MNPCVAAGEGRTLIHGEDLRAGAWRSREKSCEGNGRPVKADETIHDGYSFFSK